MMNLNKKLTHRIFHSCVSVLLAVSLTVPARAQIVLDLPPPGTMIASSVAFIPPLITGITIHPNDPLQLDFIVDTGSDNVQGEEFEQEGQKLIRYFLAALTVPEDQLWVNLSPYEENRIVPAAFGKTLMGRDLLAQDYMLKQVTASLMNPGDDLGEAFWSRVYQKAYEKYGTTEMPMNTFNKVWIVPDKAVIYEHEKGAFIVDSKLRVLLEEDYLALEANQNHSKHGLGQMTQDDLQVISGVQSAMIKEVLIPEIEREVNEGKIFGTLRQIYHSMILASWYKRNLKESLLGQIYVDQQKIEGVDTKDETINQEIYAQYVESFKTGVFNLIKEDYDENTHEVIPRKYFSGGVGLDFQAADRRLETSEDYAVLVEAQKIKNGLTVEIDLEKISNAEKAPSLQERIAFQETRLKNIAIRLQQTADGYFSEYAKVFFDETGRTLPRIASVWSPNFEVREKQSTLIEIINARIYALLDFVEAASDDQMALIIGHEFNEHIVNVAIKRDKYGGNPSNYGLSNKIFNAVSRFRFVQEILAAQNRSKEKSVDKLGLFLALRAGYDIAESVTAPLIGFDPSNLIDENVTNDEPADRVFRYPSNEERVQYLKEFALEMLDLNSENKLPDLFDFQSPVLTSLSGTSRIVGFSSGQLFHAINSADKSPEKSLKQFFDGKIQKPSFDPREEAFSLNIFGIEDFTAGLKRSSSYEIFSDLYPIGLLLKPEVTQNLAFDNIFTDKELEVLLKGTSIGVYGKLRDFDTKKGAELLASKGIKLAGYFKQKNATINEFFYSVFVSRFYQEYQRSGIKNSFGVGVNPKFVDGIIFSGYGLRGFVLNEKKKVIERLSLTPDRVEKIFINKGLPSEIIAKIQETVPEAWRKSVFLISENDIIGKTRVPEILVENDKASDELQKGGIDFNPAILNMQVKRNGLGVKFLIPQDANQNYEVNGFLPVILNITPISNIPKLIGLNNEI